MSDLRQQVRDHYDAQSLPPARVQALLAAGRSAAAGGEPVTPLATPVLRKRSSTGWLAAIAACLVISLAGGWWLLRDADRTSYAALPPRVIEFFTNKEEIVPAPQDKEKVREWLISKGAPQQMRIPPALLKLESAACQVVEVKDDKTARIGKAYMSCYWTEQGPDRGLPQLVHLLVSRPEDFRHDPTSATARIRELDGWSFASWAEDGVLYTMATAAPKEKLQPFLSMNGSGRAEATRFISTLVVTPP